jgi:hypothetical protein
MAKTIRVRAAVAVTPDGRWCVYGWLNHAGTFAAKDCEGSACEVFDGEALIRWIEADVPAYDSEPTIEGRCVEEDR